MNGLAGLAGAWLPPVWMAQLYRSLPRMRGRVGVGASKGMEGDEEPKLTG
jgi:hypothetical protein